MRFSRSEYGERWRKMRVVFAFANTIFPKGKTASHVSMIGQLHLKDIGKDDLGVKCAKLLPSAKRAAILTLSLFCGEFSLVILTFARIL